jgi:hypothetical protein
VPQPRSLVATAFPPWLARHEWLTRLLADWPAADRHEFARLIGRFAGGIHRQLDELDL